MALFNYASKELTLKVVYYGPGLSGKTTNIQHLHATLNPENKGKLLSLATETDRTLFFDFLPVDAGKINDFSVKFQLYTVPGQIRYNSTRKLVLKGADGVVFVADSQREMRQYNKESFQGMIENLRSNGIDPSGIPIVLQYNKRDLRTSMSVDELNGDLNTKGYTVFLASAVKGDGVEETFKWITEILIRDLEKKNGAGDGKSPQEEEEKTGPEMTGEETEPGAPETGEEDESAARGFQAGQPFDLESLQPTLINTRAERLFFDETGPGEIAGRETAEDASGHERYTNGLNVLMARMEEIQKALDGLTLKTETMGNELKSSREQAGALLEMVQKNQKEQSEQTAQNPLPEQKISGNAGPAHMLLPPKTEKQIMEIKDLLSRLPAAVLRAVSPSIESLQADRTAKGKEMTGISQTIVSGLTELKHMQEESLSHLKQLHEETVRISAKKKKKGFFSRLFG